MTAAALLAPFPLLLVLALLGSGRLQALGAGLAGLAAALAAALWLALQAGGWPAAAALLARELPAGLWLAWPVLAIIVPGVFFHHAGQAYQARLAPGPSSSATAPSAAASSATAPARDAPPGDSPAGQPARGEAGGVAPAAPIDPRRLWALCFLLAPFAEAVTGFGVGYLIALAALRALGLQGLPALVLGLFSQSLVPWGALAVGTSAGAAIAGMQASDLGLRTALLQAGVHALYLPLYWRFARQAGVPIAAAQKRDDIAWTALLIALVALTNHHSDPEIAAAAPCAALLALRFWRDRRPDRAALIAALRASAPSVALVLVLCATRLIAPLRELLATLAVISPLPGKPGFAPFYAPGLWVIAVALGVALAARAAPGALAIGTARGAWRSCAVTASFMLMAQCYLGSGMAQALADSLAELAQRWALLGVPLLAAMGGFLTGSAAAAAAMLMPLDIALARGLGADPGWIAAVQTSVSANLSMLSPMRVSMGTAVLGLGAVEAALYRRAWPLALPPLATGLAAALVISLRA
jgi:lactate permease